ncbi:hypothetical protein [Brevibacillus sp. NRS-1366]|uniref:hypothetical protein n=1 Tax=Brevibacillus sp. NRS-1366 TaxID=3233899 RepID=UPI003D2634A4
MFGALDRNGSKQESPISLSYHKENDQEGGQWLISPDLFIDLANRHNKHVITTRGQA